MKQFRTSGHDRSTAPTRPPRQARSWRRGFALVEATIALSMLTVVGLMLLKLSLNILSPRQWVLHQSLADAYMTYERSYAERVPFATLVANGSPWPVHPTLSTTQGEIGRLPGFTLVELTLAITLGLMIASMAMALFNQQLAFLRIYRVQDFLTEEAPIINLHAITYSGATTQ